MKRVYIFLADGFEEVEALTCVDLLRRAGIEVISISINENQKVIGRSNISILSDEVYNSEKDYNDAEAIILPGGYPGYVNLYNHKGIANIISSYNKEKKIIAAICAAPTILGQMNILKDKIAVCYPGMEKDLKCKEISVQDTIVDGHIITSRGIGSCIEFCLEIIELILGEESKIFVAKDIVYKI